MFTIQTTKEEKLLHTVALINVHLDGDGAVQEALLSTLKGRDTEALECFIAWTTDAWLKDQLLLVRDLWS